MASSDDRRWRGRAFGLSIDSGVALPGQRTDAGAGGSERPLAIEVGPAARLDERRVGERIFELHDAGALAHAIERTDGGYRFLVRGAGLYELSGDGRLVRTSPVTGSSRAWRRYLIGQVLPFAAVLQGLEVLHASAVEIGGRVVAISGPSGLGKSTLALLLHDGGAGFVTDDVLAVELRGGRVVAHPGLGLAKVRRPAGEGFAEVRRAVRTIEEPLPLGTFCLLERAAGDELEVREVPAEPRHLLGSTFNLLVATPERLGSQLEVCHGIACQARVVRASVPRVIEPAAVAPLAA